MLHLQCFNIPEEHKIHELFSEGHTFLHMPSLNTVPVLQTRAMEQWYTRMGCDGTMLVPPPGITP